MKKKSYITGIIGILFFAFLISNVSAYKWACLSYGDGIPHYTCHFSHCKLCLDDKGYSTDFGKCIKAKQCSFGPVNNDTTPPALTVNSPRNNQIFSTNSVSFNLTIDEPSTILYKNNKDSKFKTLAGNRLKYINQLTFKDGAYNITIRAEDRAGNDADILRSFYVDTKTPKIDSPKTDGNGNILIKFEESNPVLLTFKYGNNKTGYKSLNINLTNCNGTDNGKYNCLYFISKVQYNNMLKVYDGQEIESWLELKDIANNIGVSKKAKEMVDVTLPVINNPNNLAALHDKFVYFNISITEKNLDGVNYAENSTKLKWQNLCSTLKNGYCVKKVLFTKGNHDILIQVIDKSGNYATKEYIFKIN